MLPLKNRLKKRKEFETVFQEGKSFLGLFFILKIKKGDGFDSRFAFVYPIKNEKRAYKRNKGKRIFREAVREYIPLIKEKIDGIFIIKKEVEGKSYQEVKNDVEKTLKKIKLI